MAHSSLHIFILRGFGDKCTENFTVLANLKASKQDLQFSPQSESSEMYGICLHEVE